MTHFEYIAVAVSIILGLGVIQLLSNLDQVLDEDRRYWLHTMWVFYLFWIQLQNWWAFWDLRDVDWNFARFAFWISYVCVLYVMAITLVKAKSSEVSWRDHYYHRCRRFFALYLVLAFLAVWMTYWLLGAPFLHPYRLFQVVLIGIGFALLMSRNPRVHELLGPLSAVVLTVGQLTYRFDPGLYQAGP